MIEGNMETTVLELSKSEVSQKTSEISNEMQEAMKKFEEIFDSLEEKDSNSYFEKDELQNKYNEAQKRFEAIMDNDDVSGENKNNKEVIDGVDIYYDDNGEIYRRDNDLEPNKEYTINEYTYKTDEQGRIISAEGKLHLKDRDGRLIIKDSIEDIGKGYQEEGDDRGHLIGDQFDGSNGLENMVPQDADINRNDFRNFENELAKQVKEGKDVQVKMEPTYEGDSKRPSDIVVSYSVDGDENIRIFPNSKE